MKRMFGTIPTLVVFGVLIAYAIGGVWPTSWWMTVGSVLAYDAPVGQPIIMRVDRKINSPFYGEWTVIIRSATGRGVRVFCTASGASVYTINSELPTPVTLDWWTGDGCKHLPAGQYSMTTVWSIKMLPGLVKQITVDTPPFYVTDDLRGDVIQPAKVRGLRGVLAAPASWRARATNKTYFALGQ